MLILKLQSSLFVYRSRFDDSELPYFAKKNAKLLQCAKLEAFAVDGSPVFIKCPTSMIPSDHLILDSAPNLGPLISRWEINNKFDNCWYKSVRILEVLKLLCQHFLNWSSFQQDMSGPMLGDLSKNR